MSLETQSQNATENGTERPKPVMEAVPKPVVSPEDQQKEKAQVLEGVDYYEKTRTAELTKAYDGLKALQTSPEGKDKIELRKIAALEEVKQEVEKRKAHVERRYQ